jgi:hypothetical protein
MSVQSESVSVASDGANLYALGKLANSATTISTSATTAVEGKTRYATVNETKLGIETEAAVTPAGISPLFEFFGESHCGLLLSNNTSDASHDIDIAAGICRDSTNASFIVLASALTKQIDAEWAEGDDAGGFPSGLSLAANTFYRVFAIYNPTTDTTDAGFDTSASAANLLADASGYTKYRQIGWVLTDASSQIVKFFDDTDSHVIWDAPVQDRSRTNLSETAELVTISAPPGSRANLTLPLNCSSGSADLFGLITETRQTDTTPTSTVYNIRMTRDGSASLRSQVEVEIGVDASSQVRLRCASGDTDLKAAIVCLGYTFLWD